MGHHCCQSLYALPVLTKLATAPGWAEVALHLQPWDRGPPGHCNGSPPTATWCSTGESLGGKKKPTCGKLLKIRKRNHNFVFLSRDYWIILSSFQCSKPRRANFHHNPMGDFRQSFSPLESNITRFHLSAFDPHWNYEGICFLGWMYKVCCNNSWDSLLSCCIK